MSPRAFTCLGAVLLPLSVASAQSFVNWESPHVNPIDMTPDGARLLVVNTADNRLELFDVTPDGLSAAGSIPVGLDPVSVRARTNGEAWVVNHVSDSVSIVDLDLLNTIATIDTGDEPADVIFAGNPQRAFVSVSQLNEVRVYDPADPLAAPVVLPIAGEDPRALTTDGVNVYVAIFESGNRTTILNEEFAVSVPELNPYPDDPNPPPNRGAGFEPPINPDLPTPPAVGLIVKRDSPGVWLDDNSHDWSAAVGWDLHDHDVAVIDAVTLDVRYVIGVMNLNMHLDAGAGGTIAVVGTDATNVLRFEPNVNGTFVRVHLAGFTASSTQANVVLDLNPHLTYDTPSVDQATRELAIGDPRAVKWNDAASRLYVAGMGSNNLLVLTSQAARVALIDVGEGPTGIAVDDARGRVYVVNKFDGSVSVVDTVGLAETARVTFHDPTPEVIRLGRPHLYDTHETSGLGQVSCASCHIDARMDQLTWDLGNPAGEMQPFDQDCIGTDCGDWHPMKGPMTTQTFIGIIGDEPFHWRGDRDTLAAFNPAFEGLLGDDEQLTTEEMEQFEAFVATLRHPPNPYRRIDGTLEPLLANGGDPQNGEFLFSTTGGMQGGGLNCFNCHALPSGTNGRILDPVRSGGLTQSFKVPQLENLYEKVGADMSGPTPMNKGFGFIHDGSFDSLSGFLAFFFDIPLQTELDIEAFLLSLSEDTFAGVGVQVTLSAPEDAGDARLDEMIAIAQTGTAGLVAKGRRDGIARGYMHDGSAFRSDRAAEVETLETLVGDLGPGAEITFTLVPFGSQERIGIDRDGDGFYDRDEIDAGSDPADPDSVPCAGDVDGDGMVAITDLLVVLQGWGVCDGDPCPGDLDGDGFVAFSDIVILLASWGPCE